MHSRERLPWSVANLTTTLCKIQETYTGMQLHSFHRTVLYLPSQAGLHILDRNMLQRLRRKNSSQNLPSLSGTLQCKCEWVIWTLSERPLRRLTDHFVAQVVISTAYERKVNDVKNVCIDIIWRFNFNKEFSKFIAIQLINWLDLFISCNNKYRKYNGWRYWCEQWKQTFLKWLIKIKFKQAFNQWLESYKQPGWLNGHIPHPLLPRNYLPNNANIEVVWIGANKDGQ